MSRIEWQPVSMRPEKVGMVALRTDLRFGDRVVPKIIIGHALTNRFAFAEDQLDGADSHSITHWLELPRIEGFDMYFREVNHEQE